MKTLGYVVPYFGKLPPNFQLWLTSCATNPTVDWILFTDDHRHFNYPGNVRVKYCSFDEMKKRIQSHFDFDILISSPWHLSLFKPAYGEIFEEELKKYDFWGHCDVDVLWGNIRKFITDEILDKYDRIGFQGHSLFYRNNATVNGRYKIVVEGIPSYKEIFSGKSRWSFDENGMDEIYHSLGLDYYKEPTFAHLAKFEYSFFLRFQPKEDDYKNHRQIFEWNAGTLYRHFVFKNKLYTEEFMYVHFFCRPMKYLEESHNLCSRYIIYPDYVKDFEGDITVELVERLGQKSAASYYITSVWANRKKITLKKILFNVKRMFLTRIRKRMGR